MLVGHFPPRPGYSHTVLPSVFERDLACGSVGSWGTWTPMSREIPKIRGAMLVVPIIRITVYWGLYWGPPV